MAEKIKVIRLPKASSRETGATRDSGGRTPRAAGKVVRTEKSGGMTTRPKEREAGG